MSACIGHNGGPELDGFSVAAVSSSRRWVAISTDQRFHPLVGCGQPVKPADSSRGAWSRYEAWQDLICEAAWRRKQVSNKGEIIWLERGELMGARSWLAKRWNWSEKQVRTFLERLEAESMMVLKPVQREGQQNGRKQNLANVITICNYEFYQTKRDLSFHLEGQQNGQRGASEGPARGQRRASEGPDIIQEYKGTMVQERGGERFATPAAPRTAHGPVYANGEAIHGPGFMLLYASIDNLADSMGIDRNTAHSLAKATAENWVANGIQVKDPQALFLQALRGIKGSKKPPRPEYTEAFEHWWALYPRKEGKGEAWDRFRKLTLTQQRAAYKALREQAEDLKARMSDKRGNFCPHPSTWLSQHRFDDPVRASAPSNPLLVRKPQEREFEWRARIGWEIKQGAIARDEAIAAGWRPEA